MTALALSRPDLEWQADAACRGADPDLFFPERGESTREAKEICGICPVRRVCLEHALAHGERHGIWGATSERERRSLRRDNNTTRKAQPPRALTHTQIDQMRHLAQDGVTAAELAATFGVSRRTVHRYIGNQWGNMRRRALTDDEAAHAAALRTSGLTWSDIARQVGAPATTVRNSVARWRAERNLAL